MSDSAHIEFALSDPESLGKCTAEVKVSLPEILDEQLAFLATLHGVTKSAYLRQLFHKHSLGETAWLKLRVQPPLRSA